MVVTGSRSVKVAAIQDAPVFLDRDATVAKAIGLIGQAAADGCELIVFPETFVPTYPDWVWRTRPWDRENRAFYERLYDQSVDVPGPVTDAVGEAARRADVYVALGVNERDGSTLYNTLVYIGPDGGVIGKHRKLMPTGGERLVWGTGDGSTLAAVDTRFGRVGGLLCWENYMPLARAAMYAQGIDIYLAPTWDNDDVWVPTLRHIAKEGRLFVIGVNFCMRGSDVPASIAGRDEIYGGDDDWLSRGNTAIVGPDGDVLAGPLVGECGIVSAELDLARIAAARQRFDPVGHYARADVLSLRVDGTRRAPVTFS